MSHSKRLHRLEQSPALREQLSRQWGARLESVGARLAVLDPVIDALPDDVPLDDDGPVMSEIRALRRELDILEATEPL